jgi:AcrR family transcriptional regulator
MSGLYNYFKHLFNTANRMTDANNDLPFDRLLQVAVEVFAEHGFRDATVRDICARANVNVSSVNYYFRSKEALYAKALDFAFESVQKLDPDNPARNETLSPEQRLVAYVDDYLQHLLDDSQLGCHSKLIAREMADPTNAWDTIITTVISPQCSLLREIILLILGTNATPLLVERCVLSIFGQCLMFRHSRAVIDRLYPEVIADGEAIADSAAHIAHFSLAAVSHYARYHDRAEQCTISP